MNVNSIACSFSININVNNYIFTSYLLDRAYSSSLVRISRSINHIPSNFELYILYFVEFFAYNTVASTPFPSKNVNEFGVLRHS